MDLAALHAAHVSAVAAETARALADNGFDAIAIHSGSQVKRLMFDDQYFPLRVVPAFHYWAPLQQADCAVVFEPGKKPVLARNTKFDFWEAPPEVESDFFLGAFDVRGLGDVREVRDLLPAGKRVAFVGEDVSRAALWGIDAVNPTALVRALDAIRTTKTAYEVECLARANERGARGHAALAEAFRSGDASELDLHLLFLRVTAQDDQETPYKNIVALNEHAATLHHVATRSTPSGASRRVAARRRGGDVRGLLLGHHAHVGQGRRRDGVGVRAARRGGRGDAAAPLRGRRDRRAVRVAPRRVAPPGRAHPPRGEDRVGERGRAGRPRRHARVLPARPRALARASRRMTSAARLVAPRAENPFLRNTSTIAKDQSFTIEPGVYFIEPLLGPVRASEIGRSIDWTLVSQLAPFGGVRIEDDVVVTGDRIDSQSDARAPAARRRALSTTRSVLTRRVRLRHAPRAARAGRDHPAVVVAHDARHDARGARNRHELRAGGRARGVVRSVDLLGILVGNRCILHRFAGVARAARVASAARDDERGEGDARRDAPARSPRRRQLPRRNDGSHAYCGHACGPFFHDTSV